jgi:hypothetical protein
MLRTEKFEIGKVVWRRTPEGEPLAVQSAEIRCLTCNHAWTGREHGPEKLGQGLGGMVILDCRKCDAQESVKLPESSR